MVGETVGHYRIQAELGSGGMGVVYRAEDLKLGRPVALKFLAEGLAGDPVVHDRFLREARAAAALSHPNICTIYEINDTGHRPFIAMELLEGRTLEQYLASGPLSNAELLDLAVQIAEALAAAHEKGLIHRDVKPANIFVTADRRAKVVDFGLAKALHRVEVAPNQDVIETNLGDDMAVTRPGTTLGTIAYMSPEQARGESIDARSDLFSLGLVLYEMATGRRAFDGATSAIVFDGILNRTPLPPSFINATISPELEQVIACAIDKNRDARYQRARDVASDLRRLQRASDPEMPANRAPFVPSAAGPVSPGWGVTPARGAKAVSGQRTLAGADSILTRGRVAGIGAALVVVLLAVAVWLLTRRPAIAEGAPVVVADFVNRTGDADFDATLKQALSIKLEESPYLNVVRPQRIQEVLTLMARRPDDPVTAAVGREICQRIGGGVLVTGEIARLGSAFVLTLGAESCATGDAIGRDQVQAARKEDVLNALGGALSSMRGRLGESIASIRSHDKPLADATTSSLAALKNLSSGDQKRAAGLEFAAAPYYKEAVALDPQFALAWARLGTVYGNSGEMALAKECYQKAYDLRDRASEHERFYITSHYYRTVVGDLSKSREVYDLWHQQYAHDFIPVHNLGVVYEEMGDLERALQAFRDASAMEPHNRLAREGIAGTLFSLGRFDQARETAERELRELGDAPQPHLMLYGLDYLTGNPASMEAHARRLQGTPLELDRAGVDFNIALYEGRFQAARTILEQSAARAESEGRREYAERGRVTYTLASALVGFTRTAREDALRLAAAKPTDMNIVGLAFALVLAGDASRATTLVAAAWTTMSGNPATDRVVKPAFEGLVELRAGRPARALEVLKGVEPWESGIKAGLASADVRGEAYLALGDGKAAEREFQKRLDRPGTDPISVSCALAHLNVGRARALAGDKAGARAAYDEFFRLWRNADADIPVLQQARTEYAKLQ